MQCGVKMIRPAPAATDGNGDAALGATVAGGGAAAAAAAKPTTADFTGGCVGGVCQRPAKKAKKDTAAAEAAAAAEAKKAAAAAAAVSAAPPTTSDFTGGCVSGVCALPPRKSKKRDAETGASSTASAAPAANGPIFVAWDPSAAVRAEVERLANACGAACDVGSIEFLRVEGESADDLSSASRVYFDVNMLSTLPLLNGSVQNKDGVWSAAFDPWAELADYLAAKIQ